ncbi:MAG: LD-carboxypeptidase [Gammaproteobacteria bacterium]|nr:LD-carboxypeptidase [Gammaproteobacteria bacterium]
MVAPSGATKDDFVQTRVKNLEAFGLKVKVSANILATRGNAAGTPQQRVSDLHAMFLDRDVKAIWAVRGGSGASQLLPLLDYGLIRRNAKILVGYSDITALHLALLKHSRLVTFHGPTASANFTDYTATQLEAVLMHPRDETTIYMSQANTTRALTAAEFRLKTIHHGVATGRLIGGNLSVLTALIGTPYAADIRDAILFLEDVSEAPYRIDRMLTQLNQSQAISTAAGVMLGMFTRVKNDENEPALTMEQALADHFGNINIPAAYGYSFGHIAHQFTIPVGIRARLDTKAETLTLLEATVT